MAQYVVFDVETTTHTSFKRKANAFDPRNWIVLAGHKGKGDALPSAVRFVDGPSSDGWLVDRIADDTQLLVCVNGKFDLLHLMQERPRNYAAWQKFVARGGIVWDCQLAEYLLEGQVQSSHMLSLDELAVRYGGDIKIDEVKALWEAGVSTEDIDPDLLKRYLVGETLPSGERREGDIGNTELVFLKQMERARNSGQIKSIMLNMGSLCATIEMERNGMFVNEALGRTLAAKLEEDLGAARQRMNEYLPPDLPFKFTWTNRYHLSPLVFGGKIKYEQRQYDLKDGRTTWFSPAEKPAALEQFAYAQKDVEHYVLADGGTCDKEQYDIDEELSFDPAACRCTDGSPCRVHSKSTFPERVKYKAGKNAGEYKTKKVKVDDHTKPKSRMAERFWEFPGFTEPDKAWASSTEGLYSVAAEVIDSLGNRNIPFLKDLATVTKMHKDLTTYYIAWNDEKQEHVGMLTLVQEGGIIHHGLNHTSTVTGRFSSSNPNLQNIPKGNKSDVKTVFESRWRGDGCIIQSDFSSLEVYIQAILTYCANLIQDLKDGIDLHCMRLSLKEHMEYGEVFKLCKGYVAEDGTEVQAVSEWDYKRTVAKITSFRLAYGAGAKSIAAAMGLPLEEVEAIIAADAHRYPEIDAYFDARAKEIQAARRPTGTMVPHPLNPAVMCQLGIARVKTPDGKVYTYRESPTPEYLLKRGITASFTPTEIKNYEVQGEGGEWMKAAMWLAVRAFYKRGNFDDLALLVNTVHDAQYADAHNSVRLQVGALFQACMEAASDFMEWWFNWPLPLPVPTDTVWGADMGEEKPFVKSEDKVEFRRLADEYRAQLRMEYMGNYLPGYLKETT